MRSHTASQPYSRTHPTPRLGVCFMSKEPQIWNTHVAPQHWVQTFTQCCPFTRCFISKTWAHSPWTYMGILFSFMLTWLDDGIVLHFPPTIALIKSMFLLRHWRSLTCSPFPLNNLYKHSVWSFSLHFATHSHSHPLAILTSFGLFCDSKWNLHHFLPRFNAAADPMSQAWWIKPYFIQCCIVPNFQNTTLELEPFCRYIGRWIETKCSTLYCLWNKAWIFIYL